MATLGNSCSDEDEERYRVREDTGGRLSSSHLQSYFKMSFFHRSDFFISLNSKVIQQCWIELFRTGLDLLDTNRQRGRQTRSKHHTYKVNKRKQNSVTSDICSCCFIEWVLSFDL